MKNLILLFGLVLFSASFNLKAAEVKQDDCAAFAESTRRVSKAVKANNNKKTKTKSSKAKSE